MSYVIQAVLSNAQHPEYGQVTIPFPIPNQNYDCTIELLEPLEIGDTKPTENRISARMNGGAGSLNIWMTNRSADWRLLRMGSREAAV